jgi:hypothetical protein
MNRTKDRSRIEFAKRESLAAEATLAAGKKKKRQKQRNLPTKRKAA